MKWQISLPARPDTAELGAAVERARRGLDLRRAHDMREGGRGGEGHRSRAAIAWVLGGNRRKPRRLPVPAPEVVEEFRAAMQSASMEERGAREKLIEEANQLAGTQAQRERLVAAEAVPALTDLANVRELRDWDGAPSSGNGNPAMAKPHAASWRAPAIRISPLLTREP